MAKKQQKSKFNIYWIYFFIAISLILYNVLGSFQSSPKQISELEFRTQMLDSNDVYKIEPILNKGLVRVFIDREKFEQAKYKELLGDKLYKNLKDKGGPQFQFKISKVQDYEKELREYFLSHPNVKEVAIEPKKDPEFIPSWVLTLILPVLIMVGLFMFFTRRMSSGGGGGSGGGIFSIGKSKAQLFDKDAKVNITFADVAGLDEAKEEVQEVVDYLRSPKKYTNLGAQIPKGALLIGPPGTGKTLLAKAVAGEAKVPFFSMSGSDFVELFVGVGASRVRDLFKQARDKAPCIVFIDEIDAIGRARGKNAVVSNDERENTLNQLLVEMDGFGVNSGVILLAATNRPDVLDSALMRPGRFDRQISIDRPDLAGREQILKVHVKKIKHDTKLDMKKIAEQTPGFAGAELANVCNESALMAARKNKKHVEYEDFQDAIDRVIGGLEKKNKIIDKDEKKIIAYHEAGHAICGWFLEHAYPLLKVTIVPRGTAALGFAQYIPREQFLYNQEELFDQMCMTLGGRAAEEVFFKKISTGASNDLSQVTKMAYSMVSVYGMSKSLGNVNYYDPQTDNSFTKPFSEETGKMIDVEVRKLIQTAYKTALSLIRSKKSKVEKLAKELLDKEVVFKSDVEKLIGRRPYKEKVLVPHKPVGKKESKLAGVHTKKEKTASKP